MTDNNNNIQLIQQTIDQIEALKENLFDIMKYHGSIHNIKEWNLFDMNYKLFELRDNLIRYSSKQKTKEKLYIVRSNI